MKTLGEATLRELHDLLRVEKLGVEWINPVASSAPPCAAVCVMKDGANRIISMELSQPLDEFVRACRAITNERGPN